MNDRKNRIDALKAATTEFRAALEALQNSSDPQEKAEAEATLKRAGRTTRACLRRLRIRQSLIVNPLRKFNGDYGFKFTNGVCGWVPFRAVHFADGRLIHSG
jgi:hypothetical protein